MRGSIEAMKELGHDVKTYIAGGTQIVAHQSIKHSFVQKIKQCIPTWLKETIKDYKLLKLDKLQEIALAQVVQDFQPDLIYERGYYLMSAGVRVAKKQSIKHMLEMNAPFIQEKMEMGGYSLYLKYATKIERLKAKQTNKLVVVSTALKQHVVDQYEVNSNKILVCPNGINTQDWLADAQKVSMIRQQYQLSDLDFVVGFVGSILPHHGVNKLITSFSKVSQENWKLLIVGDGWPMTELKKQVEQLEIQDGVIFTGNVPFAAVKNYMALFSVGVMPSSNWYGSPVKIFEYGMMGLPVIAPDNVPVNDVIAHQKTGLLIEDESSLSIQLRWVSENYVAAKLMANKWQEEVSRTYNWKALTQKILAEIL